MAFTLTPQLGLRLDSNLTANAKFNLLVLDTIGGIVTIDSTGTTRMRGRLGLVFTSNDPAAGGSGVGGSVTFGSISQPLTTFQVYGPFSSTTAVLGMSPNTTTLASAATSPWTLTFPTGPGTAGQVLTTDGTGHTSWTTDVDTNGTVTSVGLVAPAEFSVSGSPVTTSGVLTLTKANEPAGTVWAGPVSGGPGQPAFRALVASDIPGGIAPTVANTNSVNLTIGGGNVLTADVRLADSTLAIVPAGLKVATGGISNLQVAAGAAIAYSKLNLTGSIVNADVATNAAILLTKADLHSLTLKASPAASDELLIYDVAGGTNKKATLSSLLAGSSSAATTWTTGAGPVLTFSHGLNTEDVAIAVYDLATGASIELDSIVRLNTNTIQLTASKAPPAGSWRVVILSAGSTVLSGTGTVTSVALSAPGSVFSVTGSPVTTTGTLTLGFATQTANSVFAGPVSGGAATPSFRALVVADIPALPYQATFTPGSIATATTGVTVTNGANSTVGPNVGINIQTSSASQPGLLSAADWSTFAAKQAALTFGSISTSTTGVTVGNGSNSTVGPNVTVNIQTASGSQTGLLSAADWSTFNSKQAAGNYITALTGDVVATGPGSVVATIQPGVITNAKVAAGAAIDYAKLNLTGFIVNADIATAAGISYFKLALTNSIVNADVAAGANISYSKLNLAASIVNADIAVSAAIAYSKLNLAGSLVNADVAAGAAIAYSKLNLTGSIVNADVAAGAAIVYSKLVLTNSIVNADINTAAAIAYSKLALTNSIVNADVATGAAIAYSKLNLAASIVNADVAAGAAIAYSKLALTSSIVNADIAAAAAIAYSKLNLTGQIVNADISNSAAISYSKLVLTNAIVNADIAAGAAIAYSKLNLAASVVNADIAAGAAIAYSKLNLTGQILNADLVGPVSIAKGGTGQTTAAAAYDALSPNTTKGDLTAYDTGTNIRLAVGTNGQVLTADSTQASGLKWTTPTTGTVTSVALTTPGVIFTVTGSPVTTSGTLALNLVTQTANTVFSGPTTGAAATPTFRALVAADIPALPYISSALTNSHILVGNGSNVATDVAMSGGATISNTGVVTLGNTAVTGQAITGFVEAQGLVSATDTLLQALQKLSADDGNFAFGDGSDGTVSLSSGVTTLTRDMYYENLTLSGTASIVTNGYRIFVRTTLDLTAAPANAIQWNGLSGGSSATTAAGTAPAAVTAQTVGIGDRGLVGKAGGTTTGTAGTNGGSVSVGNGGASPSGGTSGNGGTGSSGAGGAGGGGSTITNTLPMRRWVVDLLYGVTIIQGGSAGPSGGSAGGDGTAGGGSGAGGSGGNVVYVAANAINRSGSTAVGAISATGGAGGNGGTPAAGNRGGGGAGSAGGGGWIYAVYRKLLGSTATNLFDTSGGTGGTGGNGTGTGTGGVGGGGGNSGSITQFNLATATGSNTIGGSGSNGAAASGATGGAGGAGASNKANL